MHTETDLFLCAISRMLIPSQGGVNSWVQVHFIISLSAELLDHLACVVALHIENRYRFQGSASRECLPAAHRHAILVVLVVGAGGGSFPEVTEGRHGQVWLTHHQSSRVYMGRRGHSSLEWSTLNKSHSQADEPESALRLECNNGTVAVLDGDGGEFHGEGRWKLTSGCNALTMTWRH